MATCSVSCLFQYRDVTMCNESGFGDPPSDGAWLGNCLDGPCNQLMLIDGFPSDPSLPQCATHRQYRNFQTYFGACAGTRESSPVSAADDAGAGTKGEGAACGANAECTSDNCVADDGTTFVCADLCAVAGCADGFACVGGYCFPACLAP